MNNFFLENIINEKLLSNKYDDIVPNGLQIEGAKIVKKIITGVTACQKLIDKALFYHANAIIVHHGYFWKDESQYIHNMKKNRLKSILSNEINLYSWHLPLDVHCQLGNNAQIAKKLNISIKGHILPYVFWGTIKNKITGIDFAKKIAEKYQKQPIHLYDNAPLYIKRIAWCSGRGQRFIKEAYIFGVDAFLTGEISEETIHIASELGIHFFSLGHHETEKDGVKSLGEWLSSKYNIDVTFIDIYNPA
ncbi:Nif3-like dinuclear metal center hexameric protein [Buchnera aphidicola]|uniref:Nif3-like dinuclear metal center hexameric protein n=1 Tax=Buchnera aphidicola TaxID=9 RepID=UPI0003E3EC4A|nr:Nif3-like dinuclear metal center hexameric protein [Buchnera aphidicola]AHG61234.1 Ybgi [Buchnera aphidicola str. G002 (Myzus persicae)]AHG61807.1 Ybgi [Buchnera aphidicola str. F009 (Myzus persicae)]WAI03231.1 MAG: Nif3-like dinuclear metal center hexameric protein [Buchnera aphidicola (Myzus persicae)]